MPAHPLRRTAAWLSAIAFACTGLIGAAPPASAATPGTALWVDRYDGPASDDDVAAAVTVSPDGTQVFVTGSRGETTRSADYATVAYDAATGAELWAKVYDGPASTRDRATALAVSADGTAVFVTGGSPAEPSESDYATIAYDADTGAERWTSRYDGLASHDDTATSVVASPDGSTVLVTGYSYDATWSSDYATVAYDAVTGAQLWAKRYDGSAEGDDVARSLAISPDGSFVFVTGSSVNKTTLSPDYATVAYDADTGAEGWATRYDGPVHGDDVARTVGVSPDGSALVVTGDSQSADTGGDFVTISYDTATGATRWVERYDGPASRGDRATTLGVSPDGTTVVVAGASRHRTHGFDYASIAYRLSTGTTRWIERYDGPASGDDRAASIAVSPDGSTAVVTGSSERATHREDYATVAYRLSDGTRRWVERYDGSTGGDDSAAALAVSSGAVIVTGSSERANTLIDYATIGRDITTGTWIWTTLYVGSANGSGDIPAAIAASPDDSSMFVTGTSRHPARHDDDYATIAYDSITGTRLWTRRYNGPGSRKDQATALAVSPDGTAAFMTGFSFGSSFDYATVAYDAVTGARLWATRYDGPTHSLDRAQSIAASPDHARVFVTGSSRHDSDVRREVNDDYATVAYDALTGAKLWERRYDGPVSGDDLASYLVVSPDGKLVFVTGSSPGGSGSDFATVAYDAASGVRVWVSRYSGPVRGGDHPTGISMRPDGSMVFVTGTSPNAQFGTDFATVAYDTETGDERWTAGFGGRAPYSVATDPEGTRVYVSGQGFDPATQSNLATVVYDADTGDELWIARSKTVPLADWVPLSIVMSPDTTTVFVAGLVADLELPDDYVTFAYDATTGAERWTSFYDGTANGDGFDYPVAIDRSADGARVFVTGASEGSNTAEDFATVAYAS